jgi:hypothetical protein
MFNLTVVALKFVIAACLYLFLGYVLLVLSRDVVRAGRRSVAPVTSARLVVVGGPGAEPGRAFALSESSLIGRGDGADLKLADGHASERHARVMRTGSGFVLEDVGSTNGTFLGEERIGEAVRLADGDEFTVGGTTLRFEVRA